MKRCRDCANFPCLKVQCSIGNKEGCEDFKSQMAKLVKVDGLNYKFEEVK